MPAGTAGSVETGPRHPEQRGRSRPGTRTRLPGDAPAVDERGRSKAASERAGRRGSAALPRDRVAALLDGSGDALLAVDRAWRLTYANREALRLAVQLRPSARHDRVGSSLWEVLPGLAESRFAEASRSAMAERVLVEIEAYHRPLDRWLAFRAVPTREGLALCIRDVSERRLLQQRARSARARAEAAIQSRDEFLGLASHELKTPVAGVKSTTQFLLRSLERGQLTPDKLAHFLHNMDHSVDRLATLTNDLLDASRLQMDQLPYHSGRVDLRELVRTVVEHAREQLDDRHDLVVELPAQPCCTNGDPARLEQLVEKLLDNAVKYSPSGGRVVVSLRADPGSCQLAIQDQGIGLPAGAGEEIFEAFGRAPNAASRQVPGMGLGLFICRRIVERHGGRIAVHSRGENAGATVSVQLPLRGHAP